jgi:putative membrane protein
MRFTGHHIPWIVVWMSSAPMLYHFFDLQWLSIPWLPLSLIGTAVAFYVGFKNNSAYDRMWEARKIWGAIVNSSRSWGTCVKNFVTNQFADQPVSVDDLQAIKHRLFYRHIGWLYALRSQLLQITPWEHAYQPGLVGRFAKRYRRFYGIGLVDDVVTAIELKHYLSPDEYEILSKSTNMATQIIDHQSMELAASRAKGLIDDFRHMELQRILSEFYQQQGMCERIKKFPLPRQYAGMSSIFVGIFIFLLPFGMVSEFAKLGEWAIWLSIPFATLVGWVFIVMEIIGDYTENPFEGMANDVPMLSLCRTIEIDLRQMLGEKSLPKPVEIVNGVLM